MLVILFVADQARSERFYRAVLQREPRLNVPGMTEFELHGEIGLGLMPEAGIARILDNAIPHPHTATGIPRCELYLPTPDAQTAWDRAVSAGATPISPVAPRNWGDSVGYVTDPDGHLIAFCHRDNAPTAGGH